MENNLDEQPIDNDFIERCRARMKQMDARARVATRALGLSNEDEGVVLKALYLSSPAEGMKEFESREADYGMQGFTKELIPSVLRVDQAARVLVGRLGLPEERRYEVLKTLWGASKEPSELSFDAAMPEVVANMEKEARDASEKLGLPPEKEEAMIHVLYGDAGFELRAQYKQSHPEE